MTSPAESARRYVSQAAPALLAWAHYLATRGFRVFGVSTLKRPIAAGWQAAATSDPAAVLAAWRVHPFANPGVLLENLVGVDVDTIAGHGVDGFEAWSEVCAGHWLPATWRVGTASGGLHVVFRLPAGVEVVSGAGKLGPGCDVKSGSGSYLVGPGSWLSGGRSYALQDPSDPAPCPDWLLERLQPPPATFAPRGGRRLEAVTDHYVAAAVAAEVERVRDAPEGVRNETLNAAAFALARFVIAGAIEADDLEVLADAAADVGLPDAEIRRTIASALRARECGK